MPWRWYIPLLAAFSTAFLTGEFPVAAAIDLEMIPLRLKAKWQGVVGFTQTLTMSLARLLYSRLFNARAVAYLPQVLPFAFSVLCEIAALAILIFKVAPYDLDACGKLDERVASDQRSSVGKKTD